jgi:hypothetical protein
MLLFRRPDSAFSGCETRRRNSPQSHRDHRANFTTKTQRNTKVDREGTRIDAKAGKRTADGRRFAQMGLIRRLRFKAYHYNKGATGIVAREMISIGRWRRRSPEPICVNLRPSAVGFRWPSRPCRVIDPSLCLCGEFSPYFWNSRTFLV